MPASGSRALVDFALRHLRVKRNLCSRQLSEHGYALERRTVPDYNLIFVTRGNVVWTIGDEDHPLAPGNLVIVPPRIPHHACSSTPRVTLGSVHVEATLPGGQDIFALLQPPRLQTFTGRRLERYLLGALEEFARADLGEALLMLSHWARLITLELFRDNAERSLLRPRPLDPVVAALLEELERRIDRPTMLGDLAAFAGYTPQHLNRVFNRVLGVTPLQYLTRLRMDRAATLLSDGRLTVRGVAAEVGYDDPYYFSRAFKQATGRSPADYREQAACEAPHEPGGSDYPS